MNTTNYCVISMKIVKHRGVIRLFTFRQQTLRCPLAFQCSTSARRRWPNQRVSVQIRLSHPFRPVSSSINRTNTARNSMKYAIERLIQGMWNGMENDTRMEEQLTPSRTSPATAYTLSFHSPWKMVTSSMPKTSSAKHWIRQFTTMSYVEAIIDLMNSKDHFLEVELIMTYINKKNVIFHI